MTGTHTPRQRFVVIERYDDEYPTDTLPPGTRQVASGESLEEVAEAVAEKTGRGSQRRVAADGGTGLGADDTLDERPGVRDHDVDEAELRDRWPSARAAARAGPDGEVVGFDQDDDVADAPGGAD